MIPIQLGGGKAPLTFQLHDCYRTTYRMNSSDTNVGGWTNCEMRTTHLPAILELMPEVVKNNIREVQKLTSAGNQSSSIQTTNDKLFLLSEIEIFGTTINSHAGEGTRYEYYAAGNTMIKKVNGSADFWWERSPGANGSLGFCNVTGRGIDNTNTAGYSRGVSFAFCF